MKRALFFFLLLLPACGGRAVAPDPPAAVDGEEAGSTPPAGSPAGRVWLEDVAASAGIIFRHISGDPEDKRAIYESGSGGVAWLDYDGDNRLDLYLVNSGHRLRSQPPPPAERVSPALFRNLGDGRFENVTAAAGLTDWRWGMGVAVGDADNDGDPDLYVTHLGPNALWRNNGDGTFTDVAAAAGVADPGPGTGAAFGDIDGDGRLDLYVGNYVPVAPDRPLPSNDELCTYRGLSVYCGPKGLPAAADRLFRNLGDMKFEDVTQKSGVSDVSPRHSYDVLFLDVDLDGDQDIYVAADQMPSLLFINDGRGRFRDRAMFAGVALGEAGLSQAGMGVDSADPNGDGWPDLVKTNFESEVNNLYLNSPSGLFSDRAYRAGLGVSMPPMGWGAVFLDVDRDGRLDLFFANGHVYPQVESGELQYPYGQVNMLLLGGFAAGHPTFADVSGRAGPGLQVRRVSRGVAVGDYDGDGDLDLAVNNLDGAPELLRNDTVPSGAWLKVRTLGTRSNRDGLGARVDLLAGGRHRVREVRTSRGFLSSSDRTLLFGLGQLTQVEGLTVSWPSGLTERFKVEGLNRLLLVQEGQGEPAQRWPRPLP